MSEESIGGIPRSFLIISIVALLWNLMGVVFYLMQVTMSGDMMAGMPEAERALYESMPSWATGAFAIAVFGGVAASVGLLMKKAWCVPVFVVSLVAIIVQFGYWLFVTDSIAVIGNEVFLMPVMITAIAVFLLWYSRDARGRGWLG